MLRFAVCLVVCAAATEAAAKPSAGKVSLAQGNVFRSDKEEGPYRRIAEGADVYEGDFLKTEVDSRFEARLSDRSVVRLGSESRVKIQEARFAKKDDGAKQVSFKVMAGRFWAKVTKLFDNESHFEVETPNAVAGVRGTAFSVDADKDKSTTVRVFNGKVLVSNRPIYMTQDKKAPKGERKQVQGPQEVNKKQWEEMITQALQAVKVAANGEMKQEAFAKEEVVKKDEWLAWNRERDGKEGDE